MSNTILNNPFFVQRIDKTSNKLTCKDFVADLYSVDTTKYNMAFVKENCKMYIYTNGKWVEYTVI